MSSADLMRRNLDHRVEVAIPIYDKKIQETLQVIMDFAFKDNVKARILDKSQGNRFVRNKQKPFRSQQELKNWLSKS
jgi:polyphosphate kinase